VTRRCFGTSDLIERQIARRSKDHGFHSNGRSETHPTDMPHQSN
jgi:hypothetical protein